MTRFIILGAFAALALAGPARAAENKFIYAQPTALIATGVIVPPGSELFFVSGIPSTIQGGTEAQTADVLSRLGAVLKAQGYSFADVVNAKVYLVADPATGKMDFAGMNAAFKKVFGAAEEPNRPSRVTVQVAALAAPMALVEIELVAAKPPR